MKIKKKWLRIFMINLLEVHEKQNIGKMHNQLISDRIILY